MKRFLLTIAITFAFMAAYAADINPISNALKSGNASTLTSAMDKEIDMALPGSSNKCDANSAVSMLNSFFSKNKPIGFTVVHQADKQDSGFFVGKLATSSKNYRVNVTYKVEGNKAVIQSIRIE